jgi:hypothetical protein
MGKPTQQEDGKVEEGQGVYGMVRGTLFDHPESNRMPAGTDLPLPLSQGHQLLSTGRLHRALLPPGWKGGYHEAAHITEIQWCWFCVCDDVS